MARQTLGRLYALKVTILGLIPLDETQLKRLAKHGLTALLPVSHVQDIAEYCWDRGETTGDARYCSLWRSLDVVIQAFESHGYLPAETVRNLDDILMRYLPDVIDAQTAEQGALLARAMREQVIVSI